jgi:hypothetical protein
MEINRLAPVSGMEIPSHLMNNREILCVLWQNIHQNRLIFSLTRECLLGGAAVRVQQNYFYCFFLRAVIPARNPKRKSPGAGRRVKVEIPGQQGNSTLTRRPAT